MDQIDLTDGVAMVFPGQGSQFVGMSRPLYEASEAARTIFEQADEILGISLTSLCFEGPAAELEDTFNAQPAILTTSVASLAAIRERAEARDKTIAPSLVAGHSLGEFSALFAADALSFADALRLVRERGRLMKEAGQERPGGMAAVLGLDDEALAAVCQEASETGIVVVANANCPGQMVISGEVAALERAMELAKERGAKRVARLGVSIASHSPLMSHASAQLSELVARAAINDPGIPLVANVSADVLTNASDVRQELSLQMERPVNWTGTIQTMIARGTKTFIDVGPGQVLAGLIKRIDRQVATLSPADLGLDLPVPTPPRSRG